MGYPMVFALIIWERDIQHRLPNTVEVCFSMKMALWILLDTTKMVPCVLTLTLILLNFLNLNILTTMNPLTLTLSPLVRILHLVLGMIHLGLMMRLFFKDLPSLDMLLKILSSH